MKKYLLIALVLCGVLVFAGTGWSLTVGSTDVGSRDTLVAEADLANSGDATELAWVNSLGLGTFSIDTKYDSVAGNWQATNQSGTFALNLVDEPGYYLIKIGTGSSTTNHDDHFLFFNEGSTSWAVINLVDQLHFGTDNYKHIQTVERISHIDEFGSGKKVPEPSMLMLLGSGLLGLAFAGRKLISK